MITIHRDQNGFRPKSLKARNAELGGVCMCLLNEPKMEHPLLREPGGPPPECSWLLGSQMAHSSAILGHCTPIPAPLKKNLFTFTLISRMVLGVGKKSENFDP